MVARRPLARMVWTAIAATTLFGCMTGERPSLSDDPTAPGASTGDAAIDTVLERLDRASAAEFSADYTILTKYGNVESSASVTQAGPTERAVTIGTVEFVTDGPSAETCDTERDRCVSRIDDSFVSDLQVTHGFYADAAARKLRRDALDRVGESAASTDTIAGHDATCVTVTVTGGDKRYCALDSGPVALLDLPDSRVELTDFSPTAKG